jgi:hypothetical protein
MMVLDVAVVARGIGLGDCMLEIVAVVTVIGFGDCRDNGGACVSRFGAEVVMGILGGRFGDWSCENCGGTACSLLIICICASYCDFWILYASIK